MARTRPVSVLLLAIGLFLAGTVGVLGHIETLGVFTLGDALLQLLPAWTPDWEEQLASNAPAFAAYRAVMVHGLPGLLTAAALLAGLGLLAGKRWAWQLAFGYAVVSILHKLGIIGYALVCIMPLASSAPQTPPIIVAFAYIVVPFLVIAWPLAVLVVLTRPTVLAAFRGAAGAEDQLAAAGRAEPV